MLRARRLHDRRSGRLGEAQERALRKEEQAAIFVQNPCASTFLSNVSVLDPVGFGIFQRGGAFSAHDLAIDNTRPRSSTIGVAMQLDGGVNAYLQDVRISRSHGGGFFSQHEGTQVFATRLELVDTEMNPFAEEIAEDDDEANPDTTAMDIRDRAIFRGHWIRLRVSEFVGLYVHAGAEVELLYSQVLDTREIDSLAASAGFNVYVKDARLEMTEFSIRQADLCGDAASVDLHHGEVAEAPSLCVGPWV